MAVFMIYSLLLICSVSPLLYATSHGGVCSVGSYCPAGVDCSSNSSLCQAGVCNTTTGDSCIREVSLSLGFASYEFGEDIGAAQLELTLDGPIECCSISVTVKVEDITAKGGEDYEISEKRYIFVKFAAGRIRAPFYVNIIDDEDIEGAETFRVSIFELSVPYGVTLGFDTSAEVTITDNDVTILSFSKSTFNVKENEGPVQPELILSVPAPNNITVQINSLNKDLSEDCDQFSATTYDVTIPNGTISQKFSINITNDDIYEGDESFTLEIQDNLPDLVTLGELDTATVVIQEDEDLLVAMFEKNIYRVPEHQGSITPVIKLSKPSPCCFILHAQLMSNTAQGRSIDYGYATPKIYNYTFHAGSTCASPDANIAITDDKKSEQDESFKISIIEGTLPFGVKAYGPATIIIGDNDNAASFEYPEYTASEDEERRYIKIILEEPATSDRVIPVYTSDRGATGGVDYVSGIYNVRFEKGDKYKFFYVSIIDDDIYEGVEEFIVSLDELPHGVVPAFPFQATIKIEDDEYEVCFKPLNYVVEGERAQLTLTLSRPLPTSLTVQLEYFDITAKKTTDYSASPRSVTFRPGVTEISVSISTRQDSILEDVFEYFRVTAKYLPKPNGTSCDTVNVTIKDDDDNTIRFERTEYRGSESSTPPRPRLVLSKTPTQTFRVTIEEITCQSTLAIGGEDYKIQQYNDVKFAKGGSRYTELKTEFINDDIVEDDECYCLRIVAATLPDRVVVISPSFTKICILNDDRSDVTRVGTDLKFSKKLDYDVEVEISYYIGEPTVVTEILTAGDTEIILDNSRINRLRRITIYPHCRLDRNAFSILASRTYLSFRHC